jgi:hypothetical protein
LARSGWRGARLAGAPPAALVEPLGLDAERFG